MTLVENPRRAHDPFAPPMIETTETPAQKSHRDPDDLAAVRALLDGKHKRPAREAAAKAPARKATKPKEAGHVSK